MKRLIATLVAVAVVFSSISPAFAGDRRDRNYHRPQKVVVHHYHKNKDRRLEAALVGLGVGVIVGALSSANSAPRQNSPYYGYTHEMSDAAYKREMQHQRVEAQYYECLDQRNVDLRRGIHPLDAKNCDRYRPENYNWER
jgi:hypothetical protein